MRRLTNHRWSALPEPLQARAASWYHPELIPTETAQYCRKCSVERTRRRRFPRGGLLWIYFRDGARLGTTAPECYPREARA